MGGLSPLSISGRNLLNALVIVNGPIIDNQRIGPFVSCVSRTFTAANTNQAFTHILGRVPNGYWAYRSPGGIVYDASTGVSAWTATSITLRTTVAGTYSFLLF